MSRDCDGYNYDLTQQILGYAQNGTVNLGTGTVTNPQTNTTLTFDPCGNRTSMNGGGTYVANSLNQYTTFNGAAVTSDATGNLQTYNTWTYTYDAQNRLTSATKTGTTAVFYYDGKNRQIARSINGGITFSVWDDWELIEEYGTGNVRTAAYLQGAHGPVKSLLNSVYYYQDSLGSTSHIASSSGALLEYYKYDLYGKPTYFDASNAPLQNSNPAYNVRDLFSGERWISEMSIYDLRNRFYSPDLGRFLQPDPIGFKGDASNLYRYCGNDWANRSDPMGLDAGDGIGNTRAPNAPYNPLGAGQDIKMWDVWQSAGAIVLAAVTQAHTVELQNQVGIEATKRAEAATADPKQGGGVVPYSVATKIRDKDETVVYSDPVRGVSDGRGGWQEKIDTSHDRFPDFRTNPAFWNNGIGWKNFVIGHTHPLGKSQDPGFSNLDRGAMRDSVKTWGHDVPLFKNSAKHPGGYDKRYLDSKGYWEVIYLSKDGKVIAGPDRD